MNAHSTIAATDLPEWQHKPSERHWGVMIHGGVNPRTGRPQEPHEFQFFLGHYTRKQIIARAEDMAEREHRDFFMVRDTEGTVFHHGESDLRQSYLRMIDQGNRRFAREERRGGGR